MLCLMGRVNWGVPVGQNGRNNVPSVRGAAMVTSVKAEGQLGVVSYFVTHVLVHLPLPRRLVPANAAVEVQ